MPFPFIPLLAALGPIIGAGVQSVANRRNSRLQNQYNEPQRQMERFKKAGLNPNLMYNQGNPGNMTPITPTNWQDAIGGAGQRYAQAELTQTQEDLGEQKITESQYKTGVLKLQREVLEANPYLNKEYLDSVVRNMKGIADIKESQAGFFTSKTYDPETDAKWDRGWLKMQREIDVLTQKYQLGKADGKLKAEILQGKDWQNDLIKIQRDWMQDGDITPEHIYRGILLLLTKFR